MTFHWVLWSLLGPSQILLALPILGAGLLAFGAERSGRAIVVIGAAAVVVLGVLPTAVYIARPLESRFPPPRLPQHVTGIVLLSGSERPSASEVSGEPQVGMSGGRYITTLRLAALYPDARVVFTSGPLQEPGKGRLETQMAVGTQILQNSGIAASRISYEQRSRDTCDNAFNTFALVRPRAGENWVVVTSAIHMPRAIACFRAAGWPNVIAQPADYWALSGAWDLGSFQVTQNLALLDLGLHEWLGLMYYRVTGETRELFPSP